MEVLKYNVSRDFKRLSYEESFITGYKGFALHKVEWMPYEEPKGIIMIVHDTGDHILRYNNLAKYLTENGFGVVGIDLRGHGKSEGHRGSASYDDLLCDLSDLIKYTQQTYSYAPRVLYANGLGGNLALLYSIKQKEPFDGLIAASPWIRCCYNPESILQLGSNIMLKMLPNLTISNGIEAKNLSHDLVINKKYEDDSLVHHRISPKLFMEANDAGNIIMKNRHRVNVPLLLMHGGADKITSSRASAEFAEYTSPKTTLKLWEGSFHELHNEFDKEKIFDYILKWINKVTSTQRIIYGNF